METRREDFDLGSELRALRPSPGAEFVAELDARAAAGFPLRPRSGRSPLAALAARFRGFSPQRLLFAGGGTALAAIAIATVVVASLDSGSGPVDGHYARAPKPTEAFSPEAPSTGRSARAAESSAASGQGDSSGVQFSEAVPRAHGDSEIQSAGPSELPAASATHAPLDRAAHRDVERSAEIGLLAEPDDVADDSALVFSAVHDAGGIVLRSTTTRGRHAGANFDLLIPSAKLGDALAAFSAIDEVRTRHEATADITAPTVALGERLRDSRAKIDGLLTQLSAAETDAEREAAEIELRGERGHAAGLRSQLEKLHQRADFSRVSLRIETDGSTAASSDAGWGVDDALGDAGHILGIAAGVTLVGLAVIAPIALILLLAWLGHRLWLRTRRQRALDA
jgi:hypothetical protein